MKKCLVIFLFLAGCGTTKHTPDPLLTVKDFLTWYGVHYKDVNSFALVNQGNGITYSVNFEETEKFLKVLKESGFVSDAYLQNFRIYFKEADAAFKKDPVNEGPPPGFDYDIVLFTQEPDAVLAQGKNPTVLLSQIKDDKAVLKLDLYVKLQFSLSLHAGSWKIDRIENIAN
jgi:hypothetical protein